MPPDLSRCEACGAGRGIGATVIVRRTRGETVVYVCATCAGKVIDVIHGRDRV